MQRRKKKKDELCKYSIKPEGYITCKNKLGH